MTDNNGSNRLDRIEVLLERFIEESDKRISSNAKAIETLTYEMQEFKRSHEQLLRRFDNFLEEMIRDRAEVLQERSVAYQRITLLENNQSKLIDILRGVNRRVNQLEQDGDQPQ